MVNNPCTKALFLAGGIGEVLLDSQKNEDNFSTPHHFLVLFLCEKTHDSTMEAKMHGILLVMLRWIFLCIRTLENVITIEWQSGLHTSRLEEGIHFHIPKHKKKESMLTKGPKQIQIQLPAYLLSSHVSDPMRSKRLQSSLLRFHETKSGAIRLVLSFSPQSTSHKLPAAQLLQFNH